MKVIVQSKTLEITKALRAFAQEQAERLFGKGHRINSVSVFLESMRQKNKSEHAMSVKFCIEVPGKTIVVKRLAPDMYEAIIETSKRAKRYLRKRKERIRDHRRMGVDWSLFGTSAQFGIA